jgi:nitric oxide reductase subunit C
MPFWGQAYGGPLRDDQVEDITLFILNFTDGGEEALAEATPAGGGEELPSDPVELGRQLYQTQGCIGCHVLADAGGTGTVGPTHEGLAQTAAQRVQDPGYTGEATTAEEYIHESIVNPGGYVVPDYANAMPPYSALPEEQVDALVQYLMTVTAQ